MVCEAVVFRVGVGPGPVAADHVRRVADAATSLVVVVVWVVFLPGLIWWGLLHVTAWSKDGVDGNPGTKGHVNL